LQHSTKPAAPRKTHVFVAGAIIDVITSDASCPQPANYNVCEGALNMQERKKQDRKMTDRMNAV